MASATKDFEELFACLTAHGVRALVVGGYAVAFHARPRYTKDLDIFVEPSAENAERLIQALEHFGFGQAGLKPADFSGAHRVVQLGVPPNRIDFITSIAGVTFEEAWAGRVAGKYGSQPVFYLGKAELIRNKRAAGRAQDRADLEWLSHEPEAD